MSQIAEGTVLWTPSRERRAASGLARYMDWLATTHTLQFDSYDALWRWSVEHLDSFWASVWAYLDVRASAPYQRVLSSRRMPGAPGVTAVPKWFEGARLNYAEHAFRRTSTAHPAIISRSEIRPTAELSWLQLARDVSALAGWLRGAGVQPGDRVISYTPNIPETVIALLACASIGAIWSSCSPDMGSGAVLDRFRQIEPKVMFTVDGYRYGGKDFDRRPVVAEIATALPTLERVVMVPYLDASAAPTGLPGAIPWRTAIAEEAPPRFEQVAFDHPLWVVYSSGTTGLPKAIVHGHGGILVEHLKTMILQHDMHPGERFFWMSSTGWIVWNGLVSGLLAGCTIVLFDGNPAWPDPREIWRFVAEIGAHHFGGGAALFTGGLKAGIEPVREVDLSALRSIVSTGSPLTADVYEWIYAKVKADVWLNSISGGTDVSTGFVGGAPILPVTAGEMQCRCLGVAARAFDEQGREVTGEVGELVMTEPMPSMPVFFWNDPGGRRYRESYFETYPGYWRHGDWIRITDRGTAVIYGRSDTTINRYGIRMGTAEIYRAVEELPEILDSLVVDLEYLGRPSYMPLFVVLRPGVVLDAALANRIKARIRERASARHVPNDVFQVSEVPRTLTGKKMELPVRKLLLGAAAEKVASPDAMANPGSLAYFAEFARKLNPG
ncbi:MAG: acetoacetate--CoA ligase [Burkholderiales bacterium]|jgi:acetoacetyl-CoA synthetase|nr:acetoacetate--CoA ligase [Burkholderiales bacterium]